MSLSSESTSDMGNDHRQPPDTPPRTGVPFEMVVFATPRSRQTRRRRKRREWKGEIEEQARRHLQPGVAVLDEPITVRIGHYYRRVSLDVDNILKAILDGLEKVVYTNDNLIVDLIVSKRAIEGFSHDRVSTVLARSLAAGVDFVHITVSPSMDVEVLR